MFEVKDLDSMSDRELLLELVKEKRRNDILRYVSYAFYAIIMILILIMYFKYAPMIKKMIDDYNMIIGKANELSESINAITQSFDPKTIESFKRFLNHLIHRHLKRSRSSLILLIRRILLNLKNLLKSFRSSSVLLVSRRKLIC